MIFDYKIDGIALSELGAVPGKLQHIALDGLFNLPKRIGNISHNWGTSIEPFVDVEDIELDGRTLTLLAIVKAGYLEMFKNVCIKATTLSFELNTFFVICKEAIEVDAVGGYRRVQVKFYEPTMYFEVLNTEPSGGGVMGIDNYDLRKDFGIVITKGGGMDNIAKRIEVNTTEFYDNPFFRDERNVTLNCAMMGDSIADLYSKMNQFHTLLISPGMKLLRVNNNYLDVYFKSGLTAQLMSDKILLFDLTATVNDSNL